MSFFAMLWDLARSVNDTDSFAHGGYKLASRLIRKDANLIDTLARQVERRNHYQRRAVALLAG